MKRTSSYSRIYERKKGCFEKLLIALSVIALICTFPIACCFCIYIVKEYERVIIFRLGRAKKQARGPGLFFILPCIDEIVKVDIRTVSFDIPPQEILTKDSVTVAVDAVCYYNIKDPWESVIRVENAKKSTYLLAQTTLRNILGTKNLSELLTHRDQIAQEMKFILDEGTDPWGVQVERVELKDVRLPQNLQRVMAAEAEATRDARAKVINAEGEANASVMLSRAADVIDQSNSALQLRYLQTLNQIAGEKNSTIVFPIPMEMMKRFQASS